MFRSYAQQVQCLELVERKMKSSSHRNCFVCELCAIQTACLIPEQNRKAFELRKCFSISVEAEAMKTRVEMEH